MNKYIILSIATLSLVCQSAFALGMRRGLPDTEFVDQIKKNNEAINERLNQLESQNAKLAELFDRADELERRSDQDAQRLANEQEQINDLENELKAGFSQLSQRMIKSENRITAFVGLVNQVERKLAELFDRADELERRSDQDAQRFADAEARVGDLENQLGVFVAGQIRDLNDGLNNHTQRLNELEG